MILSGYDLLQSRITKKLFIISHCVENYTKFLLFLLLLSVVAQMVENTHIVFTSALAISTSTALIKKKQSWYPQIKRCFKKVVLALQLRL